MVDKKEIKVLLQKIGQELPKWLLFLIPLFYFIVGSYFRNLIGNLSLRNCDPEYIYFMSGLNLSEGILKLGHIDNPGTPLQILIAIVFKITYFFRSVDTPYLDDVLLYSDLYLSIINLTITFITSVFLLYAGRTVFRITKNFLYAFLVQTTPFVPVIWYDLIGRINPELIMPFPIIILTILIIKSLYNTEKNTSFIEVTSFAAVIAFGLSIKLSFLPLMFIPLIIILGWKKKLVFIGFTALFFFIIAFPVILQIDIFWNWIKALFMHSGTYGSGDANIIDLTALQINLKKIYFLEKRYFHIFFTLIATFVAYLIVLRKKAEKKITWIAIAIIITVIFQLLMIGKHYAHRYFIPVLMLSPLFLFLITELAKRIYNKKIFWLALNLILVFFILWKIDYNQHWLKIKTDAIATDVKNRELTWHFASTLENESVKIIASQNYGSPFIEYTLFYSQVWACYEKRLEYQDVLNRLYPNVFSHFTWDNSMKYWGEKFNAQRIIESGKKVYLYFENESEDQYNKTLKRLKEESETPFTSERELLYKNPFTSEVIYLLKMFPSEINEDI